MKLEIIARIVRNLSIPICLLVGLASIAGFIRATNMPVQKAGWPVCLGIPTNVPGKVNAKGEWQVTVSLTPINAPCYFDITMTAENGQTAQVSAPIRIFIKKK